MSLYVPGGAPALKAPRSYGSKPITAQSYEGKTTVTGTPSPESSAAITGVPFAATATGPNGQTRSVDLGFTGYSLPDGTRDTYDGVRGDFVQRVGKLVLDGTENWKYDGAIFWITAPNAKHCIPAGTHFAGAENPYEQDLSVLISAKVLLAISYRNKLGSVADFKTFLAAQLAAGTPVIVYYELAEPIAYNRKMDITAFDGVTTVTGVDAVEVIEGRVLRVADCLPFEIVRSNRNLFDNWYFPRPINQRGIASGALWGEYAYGIDRIIAFEGGVTKWVQDEGIWLMPGTGSILEERFEQNRITKNQIATFSALVNNQIASITFDLHNPGYASYEKEIGVENNRIKLEIQKYRPGNGICTARVWNLRNGPDALVTAIKLEEGTKQTLARKIGDQWVLNDPPPDPALELLKCQRYYCDLMFNVWVPKCRDVDNLHQISVRYPVTMRAVPTIKILNESGAVDTNMNLNLAYTCSAVISRYNEGVLFRLIADANL